MGLTIAEFTHDFSHLAETLELTVDALSASREKPHEMVRLIDQLRSQFRLTRAYTSYFGSIIAQNAVRDLESIELYDFAREFQDGMKVAFERRGYELIVERPAEYDIYTVPMHRSEWSSMLLNFLTNGVKAIKRAQRPGRFLIRVGRDGPENVFLEFSDNGDGIPPENRERIFEPFFTTSRAPPATAGDAAHALGTGLGLKIVADTVAAVDGTVQVVEAPNGYSTSIRVTVPASEPPELPE
jgi:signal transduction histidine kinase